MGTKGQRGKAGRSQGTGIPVSFTSTVSHSLKLDVVAIEANPVKLRPRDRQGSGERRQDIFTIY